MLHHEEGVDLLPANIELAGMEMSLISVMYHETAGRRFGCAALLVGKTDNVRIHFLHFLSFSEHQKSRLRNG